MTECLGNVSTLIRRELDPNNGLLGMAVFTGHVLKNKMVQNYISKTKLLASNAIL